MTPRIADRERAGEVEREITEAARDLLAAGGLEGLSMRHVAERVGISATAIYHYFDNKDALVQRVVADAFRRFGEYLEAAARPHPQGSLDRIAALGEGYVKFAFENQASFRVLFSMQRQDPRRLEDLPEGGGYELLRDTVVEAMDAGTIRRTEPDLMAFYLWSVVHGLVTIAMACRVEDCMGGGAAQVPADPVALYRSFRPFIRQGIAARLAGGGDA